MKPQLLIACDFDGTVTRQDTLVEILNRYGAPGWAQVQERVLSGELAIREALEWEMRSVRASRQELEELLATRVEVEPTFREFLMGMRGRGVPVILLTGGFDLCVETVLVKAGLWPVPYLANRLVRVNGSPGQPSSSDAGAGWHVEFPYLSSACRACGHCKGDSLRHWAGQGFTTVFVGNGVTDRCGAQAAALTFAKDELWTWCQTEGLPAVSYQSFEDVEAELKRRGWL